MSPNTECNMTPDAVHVWFADVMANESNYRSNYALLSKEETRRAETFKFEKDKKKYVVSKGILRRLSSFYLHIAPEDVVFDYGEFGKPSFGFTTKLKFNTSHAGDKAVFVFTENNSIGVDIELIKSDLDVMNLAENFFSEKEISDLANLHSSERNVAFYRCWTRKEAFIKAKGIGLSFPLKSFSVSTNSDMQAELLETDWNPSERLSWKLFSHKPTENYISAIAIQGAVGSIRYSDWKDSLAIS